MSTPREQCIAVTGSRTYQNRGHVFATLDELMPTDAVLHVGDATGVDALAAEWAKERGREFCVFRADWDGYGRAAGPIRNRAMLECSGSLIAFIECAGRGTRNCVQQAERMGLPVRSVQP